ncbi:MAG: hypothetical protein AAFX53_13130 [Bacteroidota bacterium]
MTWLQPVLAFTILALAVGYLAYKFVLPKSFFASKKARESDCGNENCGCH